MTKPIDEDRLFEVGPPSGLSQRAGDGGAENGRATENPDR